MIFEKEDILEGIDHIKDWELVCTSHTPKGKKTIPKDVQGDRWNWYYPHGSGFSSSTDPTMEAFGMESIEKIEIIGINILITVNGNVWSYELIDRQEDNSITI